MEHLEILTQVFSWCLVALIFIALGVAIAWPRIQGKPWLVAYLTILFAYALYYRVFDAIVRYSADEPRFELYKQFEQVSLFVLLCGVIAHVLLVIALFQIRSALHD